MKKLINLEWIYWLFQDAMEKLPQRVVIHKRTPFKNDEIEGITNALKQAGISEIDLITITQEYDLKFIAEKIMYGQFLEDGYPVDRGTCIKLSSRNALLWTHGVVPQYSQIADTTKEDVVFLLL